MSPYFVCCRNKPDMDALRAEHLEAHWAFMDQYDSRMVARGPTLATDGTTPTGSMHIVELENEDEARAFAHDEPYARAGVFADTTIRRWTNALKRTCGILRETTRAPASCASAMALKVGTRRCGATSSCRPIGTI